VAITAGYLTTKKALFVADTTTYSTLQNTIDANTALTIWVKYEQEATQQKEQQRNESQAFIYNLHAWIRHSSNQSRALPCGRPCK
jgi:hypothetical protein